MGRVKREMLAPLLSVSDANVRPALLPHPPSPHLGHLYDVDGPQPQLLELDIQLNAFM